MFDDQLAHSDSTALFPPPYTHMVANHNLNVAGPSGAKNALGQEISSPIRNNPNSFNVLSTVGEDNNEDNVGEENNEVNVDINAPEMEEAQLGKNENSFGVLQQNMENEEKDDESINAEKEEDRLNTEANEEGLFWDVEPQLTVKNTSSEHQVPITDHLECSSPAQVTPLAIEGPPIKSYVSDIQNSMVTQNPATANKEALGT
ncbi:hypothetical protein FRX31_025473, partial [Thalictrum thalictroides]